MGNASYLVGQGWACPVVHAFDIHSYFRTQEFFGLWSLVFIALRIHKKKLDEILTTKFLASNNSL